MIRSYNKYVMFFLLVLCLLVTAACAVDPKEPAGSPFGHAYAVEEITYQDGMYGFGYNAPSDAPHYRIGPEGQLLVGDTDWMPCGAFTPAALTADNFDAYITPLDPTDTLGSELRENNAEAWRSVLMNGNNDTVIYTLLQQKNGDVYIAYGYEIEDFRNIRWIFKLREESTVPIELYGAYVPNGCLYMNPLSSTLAVGGDDGSRYYVSETGFTIDDRRGGATVLDPIDWGWQNFPWTAEEWNALFWDDAASDLTQVHELRYQPLSDELCLVRADGDLWLVTLRENDAMGRFVWSIFRLVPEGSTGYAFWSYRREMNAPPPQFLFRFDLPYDEISAFCTGGQLQNGDVSGALLTYAGGEDLWWSPLDENGAQTDSAVISFTLQSGDAPTAGGTLYIERWGDSTKRPAYQARVVGAGLTLANADDGTAVIHSK